MIELGITDGLPGSERVRKEEFIKATQLPKSLIGGKMND